MKGRFKFGCPVISIAIKTQNLEVILDTGFNGHLMLPKRLLTNLNLKKEGTLEFITANGQKVTAVVYKASIELFGDQREIHIVETESDFPLAGMALFHDCRILIERHKHLVEVTQTL